MWILARVPSLGRVVAFPGAFRSAAWPLRTAIPLLGLFGCHWRTFVKSAPWRIPAPASPPSFDAHGANGGCPALFLPLPRFDALCVISSLAWNYRCALLLRYEGERHVFAGDAHLQVPPSCPSQRSVVRMYAPRTGYAKGGRTVFRMRERMAQKMHLMTNWGPRAPRCIGAGHGGAFFSLLGPTSTAGAVFFGAVAINRTRGADRGAKRPLQSAAPTSRPEPSVGKPSSNLLFHLPTHLSRFPLSSYVSASVSSRPWSLWPTSRAQASGERRRGIARRRGRPSDGPTSRAAGRGIGPCVAHRPHLRVRLGSATALASRARRCGPLVGRQLGLRLALRPRHARHLAPTDAVLCPRLELLALLLVTAALMLLQSLPPPPALESKGTPSSRSLWTTTSLRASCALAEIAYPTSSTVFMLPVCNGATWLAPGPWDDEKNGLHQRIVSDSLFLSYIPPPELAAVAVAAPPAASALGPFWGQVGHTRTRGVAI